MFCIRFGTSVDCYMSVLEHEITHSPVTRVRLEEVTKLSFDLILEM